MSDPVIPERHAVLSIDTAVEIEDRQIEAWRKMSPAERLQTVREMNRAVTDLALAGIRHRYPHASERECFLRLAAIRLGVATTRRIYPDAAELPDLRGPA